LRIGVVIPAYNAARWVGDAIASVLAQTHDDWCLVVVDDGSTDGTADVVAGLVDQRIRLIRQANAGVSAARNRGMVELVGAAPGGGSAGGNLPLPLREGAGGRGPILFLDADDRLARDALSRLAAALGAAPHAVAAVGAYSPVDTGRVRVPPSGDLLRRLLVRNLFANGGHLLIRATGEFRTDIAYGEDWELWIRLALQGPFVATADKSPVLFVRQHEGGAYRSLAADPASFVPCMDAIFGNPGLLARFGADRLAAIRRHTETENAWIVGRELIRHGRTSEGRTWLRRSVLAHPTMKRIALLAVAHVVQQLPPGLRGPFQPY
jgi:glycosyltransferase involved in cell wall biosynthesis